MNSFLRKLTLWSTDTWPSSAPLDHSWKWRTRWLTLRDQLLMSLCHLLKGLKRFHSSCRTSGNPELEMCLSSLNTTFCPCLLNLHQVWLVTIIEWFYRPQGIFFRFVFFLNHVYVVHCFLTVWRWQLLGNSIWWLCVWI